MGLLLPDFSRTNSIGRGEELEHNFSWSVSTSTTATGRMIAPRHALQYYSVWTKLNPFMTVSSLLGHIYQVLEWGTFCKGRKKG